MSSIEPLWKGMATLKNLQTSRWCGFQPWEDFWRPKYTNMGSEERKKKSEDKREGKEETSNTQMRKMKEQVTKTRKEDLKTEEENHRTLEKEG